MIPQPLNSSPVADIPQFSFAERTMKSLKLRRSDRAGGGTVGFPPYLPQVLPPPPITWTTGAPVVQSSSNQRTVLPPSSQLVPQPQSRPNVALALAASNSGRGTDTGKSSVPLGPQVSNSPSVHNSPFTPAPNTPSNTQDSANNYNRVRSTGTRQTDEKSGQGQWGLPTLASPGVDSIFMSFPGSPVPVGSPAGVFSPGNQESVTSHLSQMVPQPQSRPNVAPPLVSSNSGRGIAQIYYNNSRSPVPLGPHVSNNAAVHNTQFTPTSPTKQSWQGVDSRVSGSTVPPYVPSQPYPSSANSNTAGHVSSQSHGAASGSAPSASSTQPRQNFPRCKLPRCDKPAIFDHRINEQREYCEEHIKRAISVGFAGCCLICQVMPARYDSEFCSEACKNSRAAPSSTSVYPHLTRQYTGSQAVKPSSQPPVQSNVQKSTGTAQPTSAKPCETCGSPRGAQGKRTCSCAAANNSMKQPGSNYSVPEGLQPTCPECRRPIMNLKEARGRCCSKACEEERRKSKNTSRSK